jgi:GxxExxY protein
MAEVQRDPVAGQIIDAAIEVHHQLGPGLLESTYKRTLAYELSARGLHIDQEVAIPVSYKGVAIDCGYRLDLLVDHAIIVEVKSVERLAPIHDAQVMTYLRLTGARQALLLNFNETTLMRGLRSFLGRGKHVPIGQARRVSPFPEAPDT